MKTRERSWNIYSLYNLARYVFLKIENEYSNKIEQSGITLPQLRILWITKCFPGISLGEIAKLGCWAPPTVTKVLRTLMGKGLIAEEIHDDKRLYRLIVTEEGNKYINLNRMKKKDRFILFNIAEVFSKGEIDNIVMYLKELLISDSNKILLSYIHCINTNELNIDYKGFNAEERENIKNVVIFYNLLRAFILDIEGEHRQSLVKLDLTYPQVRSLLIIKAFPGLTSIQLSEIGFWSASTANVIVKNLYAKELIYKEKASLKNSLYLYITEKGEEIILKDFQENMTNLSLVSKVNKLPFNNLVMINEILDKMNKVIGNEKVEEYVRATFLAVEKRFFNNR